MSQHWTPHFCRRAPGQGWTRLTRGNAHPSMLASRVTRRGMEPVDREGRRPLTDTDTRASIGFCCGDGLA
eukprot:11225421-Alexandrium_andersonii.AAC.1